MSPSTESSPAPKEAQKSPFAGCSIILVAGVVMLFFVGWTLFSLFRQLDEIEQFTQSKPIPAPVLDPSQHVEAFNDLTQRLEGFQGLALAGEETAELTLSARDFNLAIAAHEQFKPLQGTFAVESFSPQGAKVRISYPLNGNPLTGGEKRYLNGVLTAQPRLEAGQLLLDLTAIDSEKGKVPAEFRAHLSDHQITQPYLTDDTLGPIMKKLTAVELSEDGLIVRADPGQSPPGQDEFTKKDFNNIKRIALTAFGVVGTALALALVLFLNAGKKKA
ncbi:hypothetical protein [Roseibacillus ishigakijimensis]|uniref:Uncharacterized protein n=1 Tax=Roseibacillus ishigakijimensis TaxID=454146 RepID=A0A934VNM9_9BACT|nr:hypothetical protein [Roseibacillus ishigakijimensis]MBK1835246.1 hypothetical protein [Roseibacillus ishigakijimensis]